MKKTTMVILFSLVGILGVLAGYFVYDMTHKEEPKKEEIKEEAKPTEQSEKKEKQNELITDVTACEKFKSYTSNESDNSFIYNSCIKLSEKWELIETSNITLGLTDYHNNDYSRVTNKTTSDFKTYALRFVAALSDQVRHEILNHVSDSNYELYILEIYLGINGGDQCISKKVLQTIGVELFGDAFDIQKHLNSSLISDNYYCTNGHQAYAADTDTINFVSKEETSDKATILVDVIDAFTDAKNYSLKVNFNIKNNMYVYDSYELINN